MYQDELARSGETLFKIRGNYLIALVLGSAAIAWLSRDLGPFDSSSADVAWFWLSLAVAPAGAMVRIVPSGYAALGTSGVTQDALVAAGLNPHGPSPSGRTPPSL